MSSSAAHQTCLILPKALSVVHVVLLLCTCVRLHPAVPSHLLLPEMTCNDLSKQLTCRSQTHSISKRLGILPLAAGPTLKTYSCCLARVPVPRQSRRTSTGCQDLPPAAGHVAARSAESVPINHCNREPRETSSSAVGCS